MNQEILLQLLDKKMAFLSTVSNTSMVWWVSTTVLCATLLGGLWCYQEQLQTAPFKRPLAVLLYFFFASVVLYGALITVIVVVEYQQIRFILAILNAPISLFDPEFFGVLLGVPIGTTSFVICLIVWHSMWRSHLSQALSSPPKADEAGQHPKKLSAKSES